MGISLCMYYNKEEEEEDNEEKKKQMNNEFFKLHTTYIQRVLRQRLLRQIFLV
jgi:hypothetical protein